MKTRAATIKQDLVVSVRQGFRGVAASDAQLIAAALAEIARDIGPPGKVPMKVWEDAYLAKAAPEDAPLHRTLIWDNEKAGDKFRRGQIDYYIRAFDFQCIDERGKKAPKVRWLQTVTLSSNRRAPITTPDMLSHEEFIANVVETALREMQSWIRRYEALEKVATLAPIFKVTRKALAQIEKAAARKKKPRGPKKGTSKWRTK